MMKKTGIVLLVFLLFSFSIQARENKENAQKWRLGVQSYTFHNYTFSEALDKIQQLGLNDVEVYFGQKLGGGLKGTMDYHADETQQKKIRTMARAKGIEIVACGVVICDSEEEWDQLFSFARNMGIHTITCEPALDQLAYVDQLANKYKINIAIHNHPKPALYWNPDTLMKALEGRSSRIGSCGDVGHWKRMGIDPVEALRICKGRVISLHFKDVDKEGPDSEDVIWGKGVCHVKGMLAELKEQHFSGIISIEYESPDLDNLMDNIRKSIAYFYRTVDEL